MRTRRRGTWDWEWRPANEDVVLRHGDTEIRVPLTKAELRMEPSVFVERILRPAFEELLAGK